MPDDNMQYMDMWVEVIMAGLQDKEMSSNSP